jgi:DNA-binding CsgD family transcriptional regulator
VKSGKTNFEIGMILSISPNTVKNHLKRIFQKLDVTCRAQAVARYIPYKPTELQ